MLEFNYTVLSRSEWLTSFTTSRYEQLVLRANSLREELHTEIDRMLNDVIKFKIHVQKSLDDYEGFVADELEKELGGDEIMQDETRTLPDI